MWPFPYSLSFRDAEAGAQRCVLTLLLMGKLLSSLSVIELIVRLHIYCGPPFEDG